MNIHPTPMVSSPGLLTDRRISRSATIRLNSAIDSVFPLFGPVLEKEWAFGWDPEILYSTGQLVEDGMIFRTAGDEEKYVWVVSKYQPDDYLVEYTVHTSQRIWFIKVICQAAVEQTLATVTYTYTSLNDNAILLNTRALGKMFANDLKDWEEAINFYLRTGRLAMPHELSIN